MKFLKTIFLTGIVLLAGCASTITGKPGDADGIPYYLPKPYLLITKNMSIVPFENKITESKEGSEEKREIKQTPRVVEGGKENFCQFQIIYLPDLTEKHCLKILSRTGKIDTKLTLINGWQLVGLNLDADADTTNIITAVGSMIPKAAGLLPSKGIEKGMEGVLQEAKMKEAGLWLYEMKVENEQMRFNLVMQWSPKQ